MAITGIDTIEGKQIIAAGATSAKYAGAAKSGNTEFSLAQVANTVTTHSAQWGQGGQAITYTATADSAFKTNSAILTNAFINTSYPIGQYFTAGITPSGITVQQNQAGIGNDSFTASSDGETIILSSRRGSNTPRGRIISTTQDNVYSGDVWIVDTVDAAKTVKDNSASWGGYSYTGNVQEALDEVYTNSGEWNESYNTLTANSASWGTTYTGNVQEALDEVYTNSSNWNGDYYSASNPSAFVTNDELTAALESKEDTLTFSYTDSKISQINGSAIYSQAGTTYTGDAQGALDEVYTNSSNWNESYDTLTANSASWGGDELPLSAGEGISLSLVDNKLVISDSGLANKQDTLTFGYTDSQISQINGSGIYSQAGASYTGNVQEALDKVYTDSSTWDNVTAKQDKLTFNYDGSDNITGINSSAIGGVGATYTGNVQEALDEVYTASSTWNNVTAKQDTLTFNYDGNDNITGINSSAIGGGGGGSQVVTATGGTTSYIQTINEKPVSASIAESATSADTLTNTAIKVASASTAFFSNYDSNGVFLSDATNSARSGYAASSYLASNVTGNVANWNAARNAVTANSGYWGRKCSTYASGDSPSLTGTAGVGPAGLRFNIGSMISYSHLGYRVIIENLDGYTSAYNINFRFQDVVGTQWSQVNNVITVRNGHIIAPYLINIWAGWENEPRIQLVNRSDYATGGEAILRNLRNSSTAENNVYYGNGTIYVASW